MSRLYTLSLVVILMCASPCMAKNNTIVSNILTIKQSIDNALTFAIVKQKNSWDLKGTLGIIQPFNLRTKIIRSEKKAKLNCTLKVPFNAHQVFYYIDQENTHKLGVTFNIANTLIASVN